MMVITTVLTTLTKPTAGGLSLQPQPQRQVQHSHHAVVQDSSNVQMAGVYQFLLHVLYLGVSRGTSAVMGIETVVTTVMRPAALV